MSETKKVIYYVNQFFGGIGGEDTADFEPEIRDGAVGPAMAAQAALEKMGVAHLAHRPVSTLSGGQRQKVYIAMALAQDTPVVLLDEPNTFLDISHQLQLMAQAQALAREGKTVVLVLHDLAMALETAGTLVVMDSGRVLCQGTPETVFASGALDRAFGVTVKRVQTPDGWKYYYVPQI